MGGRTHGYSKSGNEYWAEYSAWLNMKMRCYNPKRKDYKYYGGLGVSVCDEWKNSFENFLMDMGKRPSKYHSLDRHPNLTGNYEPSNCRWATKKQQSVNRKNIVLYYWNDKEMPKEEWAKEWKIHQSGINYFLKKGLSFNEIAAHYEGSVRRVGINKKRLTVF